jgi:hypothetical protein
LLNFVFSSSKGVDSIPEDRILYFHPEDDAKRKRLRNLEDDNNVRADLLLRKLLDDAKIGILNHLDDQFNYYLNYLKKTFTLQFTLTLIGIIFGIFIVEKLLKILFSKYIL